MDTNITNIFFNVLRNTSLSFTVTELDVMMRYIAENSYFSAKCLVLHHIRNRLDNGQFFILLNNADLQILINNEYFNICSPKELEYLLMKCDKDEIKMIIDKTPLKSLETIKLNASWEKNDYIRSLITHKKLSN